MTQLVPFVLQREIVFLLMWKASLNCLYEAMVSGEVFPRTQESMAASGVSMIYEARGVKQLGELLEHLAYA